MKPIRIFTPVFGVKHINWLDRALGRSLNWPDNRRAMKDAKWLLFLHPSEFQQVMTVATKYCPQEQIETIESDLPLAQLTAERGIQMCIAFAQGIRMCLADGRQMLISTPDFIWSDGSIYNMRQLAQEKNSCLAVPHPRVTPEILGSLDGHEVAGFQGHSQEKLVTLARQFAHASWIMSENGKHTGTFKGGILWRPQGNACQTLQHRMPSPYLCNFINDDLKYFTQVKEGKHQAWGAIDHDWAVALCEQQRWRQVLSSDLAYMCEVTEQNDNVPPVMPMNNVNPDDFWTQDRQDHLLHHKLNRQFIATFRGEP